MRSRTAGLILVAAVAGTVAPAPARGVDPPLFTLDAGGVMGLPGTETRVAIVFSNNPGAPARDVSWRAEYGQGTTGCAFTGSSRGTIHLEPRSRVQVDLGVSIPTLLPAFYECCGLTIVAVDPEAQTQVATDTASLCPAGITPVEINPADRIPLLYWVAPWRGIPAGEARRFDAVLSNQSNNERTFLYRIEALPLDGAPPFTLDGSTDAVEDSARLDPGGSQAVPLLVGVPGGTGEGARNELRLSVNVEGIPLAVSAFAYAGDFTTPVAPATWGRVKALYAP